jgi:hypothetical protein
MDQAHFRRKIGRQNGKREESMKNADAVHNGHGDVPLERKQSKPAFGPMIID